MKFWRLVFSRLTIIALFLLIQLIIFFVFTLSLSEFFIPYQITSLIVGLIVFLKIIMILRADRWISRIRSSS